MRKTFMALAGIFLMVFSAFAQTGDFKFTEETFDFGLVKEGAQATHKFTFTNIGDQPIVINNVRASCGCTTPDWPKDPIQPGEEGVITASYNSKNRIGKFNKSITITSNAVESRKVLYIKGVVNREDKKEYTEEELKGSPQVKLKDEVAYDFGDIIKSEGITQEVTFKNKGKSDLNITKVQSACNCIKVKTTPEVIKRGKKGSFVIEYKPYRNGFNKDVVIVNTNDVNNPVISFTLSGNVVDKAE